MSGLAHTDPGPAEPAASAGEGAARPDRDAHQVSGRQPRQDSRRHRLAIVATHPIQYYSPWFAHLSKALDVHVFYGHRQTAKGQAAAGFSTAFEWDVPLLEGHRHTFLDNRAKRPGLSHFGGIHTPDIGARLAAGKFDALMLFGWNKRGLIEAWRGARRAGVPVLVRLDSQLAASRGGVVGALKRPIYGALLPFAAHYLSPGARTDQYLAHYGVRPRRIHRVPHMVDVERFAAGAAQARESGAAAALRARHGAAPGDTVFLFVGKLIGKKRPRLLLEALSRLPAGAPAQLWMIGDGPLEGEVDAWVASHGLPVKRLGFVNQSALPAHYGAADCLVLPSDAGETWGLVVNEAQACGLPAIVSAEAGCAGELIADGVTGWTMRTPDAEALAKLMQSAIDTARHLPREAIHGRAQASSYAQGTARLTAIVAQLAQKV